MKSAEIKALLEEADLDALATVTRELPDEAADCFARLAALLRELTQVRPMSEAPKDGTCILIVCQDMPPQVMHWGNSLDGAAGWRLAGGAPSGGFHSGAWFDGWLPTTEVLS